MSEIQKPSIIEHVQAAAQRYGIKVLAGELNKAPSTVYSELNPWGDRSKAKLGLEDAIEIMRITEDFSALELMAADLGFRLVVKEARPDKASVAEELCQDTQRMGEWARVCSDPKATETEVRRARQALAREADQTEALKVNEIKARAALRGRKI